MVNPVKSIHACAPDAGFVYLGLLVFIAIVGIGLSATGVVFHQQGQREKEAQLLFAGDEIRRAIGLYYDKSPGGIKQFPRALDDLLLDRRYPGVQRYLRRVYVDPMTGSKDWVFISAPDGGIRGVHSSSPARPLKTDNFPHGYDNFKNKDAYAEWQFQYTVPDVLPNTTSPPAMSPSAGTPGMATPASGLPGASKK
jgi:type II secretory pathway pseudopilin PulG